MKKYIRYIIFILSIVFVIVGCIRINIYNTTALSPIGNSEENFETVSNEFGEDFTEFIMDDSPVKIYIGEEGDGESMVKIGDKEINLTTDNQFLGIFTPFIDLAEAIFSKKDINNELDDEESLQVDTEIYNEVDEVIDDEINN